jgi:hypothetical protein
VFSSDVLLAVDVTARRSVPHALTVSAEPAPFGLAHADAWFSNADGTTDTQAGSHPYEATFIVDFNTVTGRKALSGERAEFEARNLTFNLPPGFVGDPTAVPRCPLAQFNASLCPAASQVGILASEPRPLSRT